MSLVKGQRPPPMEVAGWVGAEASLGLGALRGRAVLIHAFQMLCPGCVSHGLPQVQRVLASFDASEVAVIGLHSVFEHHAVMGRVALEAFMHEYRIGYPVAIDAPGDGALPRTMQAWGLRGTPSLVLLDRQGRVRMHAFGQVADLALGAAMGEVLAESTSPHDIVTPSPAAAGACDEDGCRTP